MENVIRQQLSVHSEDRDVRNWPNSNHFEVELPVDYKNVAAMRLLDIELPANFHVFTHVNQNTRLVLIFRGELLLVEITQGTYRPPQMANELAGQLNAAAATFLSIPYTDFSVQYNEISQTFVLLNSTESFGLDFTRSQFDGTYQNYSSWGLGYNLGFKKATYTATNTTVNFYWKNTSFTGFVLQAPDTMDLFGDSYVYMELVLFNSMDEIMPYTERSTALYNSKQGGKHNSAFAKIPIVGRLTYDGDAMGQTFMNRTFLVPNVFWSEPPLERIQKLKFKFRFHDGRPVDFGTSEFTFTVELSLIRTDVPRFSK